MEFVYEDTLPAGPGDVPYRLLTTDGVRVVEAAGRRFLEVDDEAIRLLTAEAMRDMAHLLRPGHLQQLRNILDDPEASANDRFVATELLRNANIAAGGVLPGCQDTGTAIIKARKGQQVLTGGDDRVAISRGVFDTYQTSNLRYSQLAPLDMFSEQNTGNNLPAEISIEAVPGEEYKFLFIAKGGGSANKSFLYQQTRAVLNPDSLVDFLDAELRKIGTAACPPYHLAVVIGGTSAEYALQVAKLASARYLDHLPKDGSAGGRAFRDTGWEERILELTRRFGIGAQFGGKYFCHDVRVVRLARHAASCPVAIAVSCSADRQVLGRINADGVFLEALETDPARFLPATTDESLSTETVAINLDRPMTEIQAALSAHPIRTRVSLTGTLVVARDAAHARIKSQLDAGGDMPDYLRRYPVYYAGPAKTPEGYASGSFGPTTAGRMDSYVEQFQAAGGSLSCSPRATAHEPWWTPAPATGGSTWAPSAVPAPAWPPTRSARWRSSTTPIWAWRPSGASRWRTSRPSSSSTTRATTSSPRSPDPYAASHPRAAARPRRAGVAPICDASENAEPPLGIRIEGANAPTPPPGQASASPIVWTSSLVTT